MDKQIIVADLQAVREKSPLIHNITNYVVMNNTANALLAIGASPVMAHAAEEMEEMTSIASALVLNIGTLSHHWVEAMLIAGHTAKKCGIPIVLDPVGAGATTYRTETCLRLLENCKPDIIRGNGYEIMALVDSEIKTKGVDSRASSSSALDAAKYLAKKYSCIVSVSGAIDYTTDGVNVIECNKGVPLMAKVTGLGCTSSCLVAAFAAVDKNYLEATAAAMAIMGIAGEMASENSIGTGSMQMNFLDALTIISENDINQRL